MLPRRLSSPQVFDGVVFYEDIRDALTARADSIGGEIGRRLAHRADLLSQAVEKYRRGYVAVPLPVISDFNKRYVNVVRSRFPALLPGPAMLKDGNPGESVTMIFSPDCLPKSPLLPQMRLVHQLREANANINFYTWGDRFGDLASELAPLLRGTGYKLQPIINRRKSGTSGLMVIAATPKVDNQAPFEEQLDTILAGMAKADELRCWFLSKREALIDISRRIGS